MQILIESIPHKDQRYDTCGDYYNEYAGDTLRIKVSELADKREMLLIAIHELIEWAICDTKGITNEAIDTFDMAYGTQSGEPGDDPAAPYYLAHQIATVAEQLVASIMGVDWAAYKDHVKGLKR